MAQYETAAQWISPPGWAYPTTGQEGGAEDGVTEAGVDVAKGRQSAGPGCAGTGVAPA